MHDYSGGIKSDDEDDYQDWLRQHPNGFVISLATDTLHKAHCQTLSYNLAAKDQTERSGKVCFENRTEMNEWLEKESFSAGDLNRCSRC